MSERNILTAVIMLLLPLSFGLDPGAGRGTATGANANYFAALSPSATPKHEFTIPGLIARHSVIPGEFAVTSTSSISSTGSTGNSQNAGVFESSLHGASTLETESCDRPATAGDSPADGPADIECSLTGGEVPSGDDFGIGAPIQDSFSGSHSSDNNSGGIGGGGVIPFGSGGSSGPSGPSTPTGTSTPDAPVPTPEPGSLAMLACGLLAVAVIVRKRSIERVATVTN